MIRGLDLFKEYFANHQDCYILIGGAACDIVLSAEGLTPRATKDLDVVLIVETLRPEFVAQFWKFIKAGEYAQQEKGERNHYRFLKPANTAFPVQVEFFSRTPDAIEPWPEARVTPIPAGEGLSSLSAFLMDDDYYEYTIRNAVEQDGVRRAAVSALMCLKAIAYLNLKKQKEASEAIDEKNIQKHKMDVFRLAVLLARDERFALPEPIKDDMQEFVDQVQDVLPGNEMFKALGLPKADAGELIAVMRTVFLLA